MLPHQALLWVPKEKKRQNSIDMALTVSCLLASTSPTIASNQSFYAFQSISLTQLAYLTNTFFFLSLSSHPTTSLPSAHNY